MFSRGATEKLANPLMKKCSQILRKSGGFALAGMILITVPALATPFSDGAVVIVRDAAATTLLGKLDDENGTLFITYIFTENGEEKEIAHNYIPAEVDEPGPGETSEQPQLTSLTAHLRPQHFEKPRTLSVYLTEPTGQCSCTENETNPGAVSDVVTLTVAKTPGSLELYDFQVEFISDPSGEVPSKLPPKAVTLAENGLYQDLSPLLFPASMGYTAGAEPLIVRFKSCSCEVAEPGSLSLVFSGMVGGVFAIWRQRRRAPSNPVGKTGGGGETVIGRVNFVLRRH